MRTEQGDRMAKIRRLLKMTQEDMAYHLNLTQSGINQYENNGKTPTPAVAKRVILLARERGISITYCDIYGTP